MNVRRQSLAVLKRVRAALEDQSQHISKVRRAITRSDGTMSVPQQQAVKEALEAIDVAVDRVELAIAMTDEPTVVGFRKSRPPSEPDPETG